MMRKYIVAVSGGVDSVVLLDMLTHGAIPNSQSLNPSLQLIVAHFDHGIRDDSADDAQFVGELAQTYGLHYETRREELGTNASEEQARTRRYAFLRQLAKKYDAHIVTAHHGDDVVETVAINMIRGTGWRGLAVLDSEGTWRPLLHTTKAELYDYASRHDLAWHEDSTNSDTKYLRNQLRQKMKVEDDVRHGIELYRNRQVALKREIDSEAAELIGPSPYSRHLFIAVADTVACELLRAVLVRETSVGATRPQLQRALHAIKTLQPAKRYEVAAGRTLLFTKTGFVVVKD